MGPSTEIDPLADNLREAGTAFSNASGMARELADSTQKIRAAANNLRSEAAGLDETADTEQRAHNAMHVLKEQAEQRYYSNLTELFRNGSPTDRPELRVILDAWRDMSVALTDGAESREVVWDKASLAKTNYFRLRTNEPLLWTEPQEFEPGPLPVGDYALRGAELVLSPHRQNGGLHVVFRTKNSAAVDYEDDPLDPRSSTKDGDVKIPLLGLSSLAVGEEGIRAYLRRTKISNILRGLTASDIPKDGQERLIEDALEPYRLITALASAGLKGTFTGYVRDLGDTLHTDTLTAYGIQDKRTKKPGVYATADRLLAALKEVTPNSYEKLVNYALYFDEAPSRQTLLIDAARLEGMAMGRQSADSYLKTFSKFNQKHSAI